MQINRLFEIIYLLINKESITARELAEHFEVSPRTIYRDVELLSSAGIPIYMTKGKGGGISLLSDFILNKAVLTEGEKSDILSALYAVEAVKLEQVSTAVQKLSSLFGSTNTDWVEVDFSGWANEDEEAQLFCTLKAAIIGKQRVAFYYHSSKSNINRKVEPMKLCFRGQSWYLYAYCTVRRAYRFFKLRRIRKIVLLNERFERPIPVKIFGAEKVLQEDSLTITLKLSKEMGYRVCDEFSQYKELPDGSFLAKITMPRGNWIYHYFASFGEHCEIIEPEDVRLQVRDKLKKTLEHYL